MYQRNDSNVDLEGSRTSLSALYSTCPNFVASIVFGARKGILISVVKKGLFLPWARMRKLRSRSKENELYGNTYESLCVEMAFCKASRFLRPIRI